MEEDLTRYGKLRYRKAQYLIDHFWYRWREEYVHSLTIRRKWTQPKRSLEVGDVVLLNDKGARRNEWPMGVVTQVKRSQDGLVRSATIKLANKTSSHASSLVTRPINKMVLFVPANKIDE